MPRFPVSSFDLPGSPITVIASNRKAAAVTALVFPLLLPATLLVGLAKHGFDPGSIFRHSGLSVALVPGIVATTYWVRRYWISAWLALAANAPPIYIDSGKIFFFGSEHSILPSLSLDVVGVKVRLLDGDGLVGESPSFFIRSGRLELNRRNL